MTPETLQDLHMEYEAAKTAFTMGRKLKCKSLRDRAGSQATKILKRIKEMEK